MPSNRVYSTDQGRICPTCNNATAQCRCKNKSKQKTNTNPSTSLPNDGIVRLTRETKGRKGAGVTLINGLQVEEKELKKISKALKALCGCGGAIKNGVIEIQGDQHEKVKTWLEKNGHTVKIAGG